MDSYDLFSAMSGASEDLLARSDHRANRHSRELAFLLTAAACLAVVVISIVALTPKTAPEVLSTQPPISTYETEPVVSEPVDINHNGPLKLSGGDVGTLNLLIQLAPPEETASMPDFLMYVNSQKYRIAEGSGIYYIMPISSTENMPTCQMTITWQGNITVEDAAQQQIAELSSSMETVCESRTDLLTSGLMIHGSNGSEWDSTQTEVYITSDLQGGVFISTLNYYLKDTDGHAVWFRDMLQTFEIVTANRERPLWMTDLCSSVDGFIGAFLKNDFSGVEDLIAENAEIYTYDADVLDGTRVLKTHYTVDDDTNPTSAQVSVRHKYLENDAYDYITIELKYIDGKWQITGAGIER